MLDFQILFSSMSPAGAHTGDDFWPIDRGVPFRTERCSETAIISRRRRYTSEYTCRLMAYTWPTWAAAAAVVCHLCRRT